MEYVIEEIEEKNFLYMRRVGEYGEENYELMSKMQKWIIENNLWNKDMVIYVIAKDDAETTPIHECRCDIGIIVDNISVLNNDEVHVTASPSGKYAIFEIKNEVASICKFWHEYSDVLAKNDATQDKNRRIIQRYTLKNTQNGILEYCVPIL